MRLLKKTNIDFLARRRIAGTLSGTLIVIGILSLIIRGGPAYSIDFTGGTLAQLQFDTAVDIGEIRTLLLDYGFTNPNLQRFGSEEEIIVRVPVEETSENFSAQLQSAFSEMAFEVRRLESVGPKIGGELRRGAIWSALFALLGILIYIAIRFDRWYAVGAVAALAHDVLITLGIFSIFNLEIDLAIIAAFLTIIGYSLNDTIVVYDRIRENVAKMRDRKFPVVVNTSINETLSRTLLTSLTTLFTCVSIWVVGTGVLKTFAFALTAGVLVGTYSSVFIASPITIVLNDRLAKKKAAH